ncbi:MAG: LarC family nickel insertion protein [Clostridia bacterium]|nr:LarC family nickel insertion protein [Clostridia bacterium]
MTEKEYIKCLKTAYRLTKSEIEEDLSECRRIAEENGVSLAEVYDIRAGIATCIKVVTISYDEHNFCAPQGNETDQEG